jgi:predicted amidohydrolase YtcJ
MSAGAGQTGAGGAGGGMPTDFFGRRLDGEPIHLMVEDGRIVEAVPGGPGGPILLPGFVDAHCHVLPMGLDMLKPSLAECDDHAGVLDVVRSAAEGGEGWVLAVQYDQNRLPGARHLTREELDAAVPDRPVLVRHANGHASVANSAALRAADVGEDVEDPEGGTFHRGPDGRLTGLLLERAHEAVTACAPAPDLHQMVEAVRRAQASMASLGITCATDMLTGRWDLGREFEAYRQASEAPGSVRLRLFAIWSQVFGPKGVGDEGLRALDKQSDPARCRVAGIKIFADGAIASATAAVHEPYVTGGLGKLIYPPERLAAMVLRAHDAGWPVAVHAIGDRAVDHVLDAFEATGEPARHRLEHAMVLSDAQIARIARLGCEVTMQPEFLLRFGAAYRNQLGPERAARLKRLASLLAAGVPTSLSSDRPIVPGDPWDGIEAASSRPDGFDPKEAVPREVALELYMAAGARANGDEAEQGVLRAGMRADFQAYPEGAGKGAPRQVWCDGLKAGA